MDKLPSGTVTFLFTDIEDSTRLWQEQPEAMSEAHARHDEILHEAIEANHGYVFQIVGDSFSVAFHNAIDGLKAALAAQRGLETRQNDSTLKIRARMGLHTGAAEIQSNGKYDGYVTVASCQRVMSVAHGGQVLLSHTAADLFNDLPKEVSLRDLGEHWKKLNERSVYVIDSYPILVCDNYRIPRSKIYQSEDFRGYIASKKRYFYGLRIHIMVTEQGEPVEFFLAPGAFSDTSALLLYQFDVPEQSWITGDKAYNDYAMEDLMREAGVELLPLRKKNSLRPVPPYMTYMQQAIRKIVETAGSLIERLLPKSIHAVTAKGFELKVALFVLASSINFLW